MDITNLYINSFTTHPHQILNSLNQGNTLSNHCFREEPSLKLDKESENEFKNINKMLKDTIEGQDQQEEE